MNFKFEKRKRKVIAYLKHIFILLAMFLKRDKVNYKNKKIIFMIESKDGRSHGLADKLKGIITIFDMSNLLNISFYIHWTYPVDIKNYLLPHKINWNIEDNEIIRDNSKAFKIDFTTDGGLNYYEKLIKIINALNKYEQVHVFSNSRQTTKKEYRNYFKALFKPTDKLQSAIEFHLREIGCDFVSVTFRFQQLLGDFEEGGYPTLPKHEQDTLIDKCITHLQNIKKENQKYKKILVTSDSITFLSIASKLDFVYVISGKRAHFGHNPYESVDVYLNSFIDYYLLTFSKCIFIVVEKGMYNTGFPKSAAYLGGTKVKVIKNL